MGGQGTWWARGSAPGALYLSLVAGKEGDPSPYRTDVGHLMPAEAGTRTVGVPAAETDGGGMVALSMVFLL